MRRARRPAGGLKRGGARGLKATDTDDVSDTHHSAEAESVAAHAVDPQRPPAEPLRISRAAGLKVGRVGRYAPGQQRRRQGDNSVNPGNVGDCALKQIQLNPDGNRLNRQHKQQQ